MAKSKITGITLKIEGDTKGLTKSLQDVNKSLSNTQSALRSVERALKLDPKNTELLAQKQELLTKAIEETKQKLEVLKQAGEQAAEALQNGDITQEEYAELTAEISRTESSLKSLEAQAKASQNSLENSAKEIGKSFEDAGKKIQDVGKKVTDVGKGFTKNVTAPIVGAGTAAFTAYSSIDDALDNIAIATGATGETLAGFEDIAKSLGATLPVTFENAAFAVGEVNTRFGTTGAELENLSADFLKFTTITGDDVVTAVDDAQSVITAFNLSVNDTSGLLDALLLAEQKSGITTGDLTGALISNVETFNQLGLSVNDSIGFLSQLELSGADVNAVMAGLKKALKEATDNGTPLNEALADIQNNLLNANTDVEALNVAFDTFGSKSAPVLVNALQNGSISFTNLAGNAEDAGGTVNSTFETIQGATDDLTIATNNAKLALAGVGESLAGLLAPALQSLSVKLQQFTAFWNNLSPAAQTTILTIAAIVAAIGPVIMIIGSLISAVGTITAAIGAAIPVIGTVAAAIGGVGAPVLAVVAAIGAVIAIGALLISHWEEVKQTVADLGAKISDKWNEIKTNIGEAIQTAVDNVKQGWQNMVDGVSEKLGGISQTIIDFFGDAVEFLTDLPNKALSWGKDLIDNFIGGLKAKWDSLVSTLTDFGNTVKDYIGFSEPDKGPLSKFHTFAPDLIDLWNKGINDNLPKVALTMQGYGETVAQNITPDYSGTLNTMNNNIKNMAASERVTNVYIGEHKIDSIVSRANQRNAYRSGRR